MPSSRVLPAHQQRHHNSQARCSTQKEGSTKFRQRPKGSVANYPSVPSARVLPAHQQQQHNTQARCSTQKEGSTKFRQRPKVSVANYPSVPSSRVPHASQPQQHNAHAVCSTQRKAALNFVRDPRSRLQITHQCHHHVCCLHPNRATTRFTNPYKLFAALRGRQH